MHKHIFRRLNQKCVQTKKSKQKYIAQASEFLYYTAAYE